MSPITLWSFKRMKILLISPWRNVWVDYFKKFFETKGHTLDYYPQLVVRNAHHYDVLISGWADAGVKWLSRHPKLCSKYICWVRSYEYWHNNMSKINWENIDNVLFTNKAIRDGMVQHKHIGLDKTTMVHNAIDLDRVGYKEKKAGKKVLFLADLNFKKGIPLLMQIAMKLPDYKFYIYGNVDSKRDYEYLRYYNLPNLFVCGYEKDICGLFDKMNYILLTSPVEGNPNCIIEGMASGLKPVVHRFVGSEDQYPFYWDTIDEAVTLLTEDKYESLEYRKWVEDKYDMWEVYKSLEEVLMPKEGK